MKRRLVAMLTASAMAVCMLAGCGAKSQTEENDQKGIQSTVQQNDTGEIKTGGTMKYAAYAVVSTTGYTPEITNNSGLLYLTAAYESLTTYDEEGNIAPNLATEWTVDAEEPSITWTLRENVSFADGEPFNAEAVKRNIEEYQSCERNETANIASCEVIDDTHLKMVLEHCDSSTLEAVGFFVYYMSPKALEDVDSLRNSSCGTGQFQVTEFESGVYAKYEKNENYWQEGKPYLDGIEIDIIDDPTTRAKAFEAGEYDIMDSNNLAVVNDLLGKGEYVIESNASGQGLAITGLIPNSADEDSPFAKAEVRRALGYALDSEAICEAFGYGMLTTTDQWGTENAVTYNKEIETVGYDPEKAKELLAAAGYPDGFDTKITTTAASKDMMTAVAGLLEQVGIRCQVDLVDGSALTNLYSTGTWDGLMEHFAAISPDLGLYMGRHLDYDGAFYAKGIQHPDEAMELLEKIRTAPTEEEKVQLEHEMQELLYNAEDGLYVFGKPIYIQNDPVLKYDYVINDNRCKYHVSTWTPAECWLNK